MTEKSAAEFAPDYDCLVSADARTDGRDLDQKLQDMPSIAQKNYNAQAPSRAGDRYHYVRTARLCLTMLAANADLIKVVVEGAAEDDLADGGEDVIDLALYRTNPDGSRRVSYRQFKHSLMRVDEEMTASDVVATLRGFAVRFESIWEVERASSTPIRHEFEFETNRPIADTVAKAIRDLESGRSSSTSDYLRRALQLQDDALRAFASRLRFLPRTPSLDGERAGLWEDTSGYLPETDRDVPIRLVEMVAEKAAKQNAADLKITRLDVLRQMDCDEHALGPAPSRLESPAGVISRPILTDILSEIVRANGPIILQAEGGIGKSVAAMQLPRLLPPGSASVVYDCFGNGSYRDPAHPRHQPRQALVQIANEMAFQGLCGPLIPSNRASEDAYARAFLSRVGQAARSVGATPDAVLLIVVDAADNAEVVASERSEAASFARGLLRMTWPANVRIVLTTRPERRHLLDPPPDVLQLDLPPFVEAETTAHLRSRHPSASDAAALAFHRLTSANPRLQRNALDGSDDLEALFDALGPEPLTVQGAIETMLQRAVDKAQDNAGRLGSPSVQDVCRALAVLRPFVPLDVIARVANVETSFVVSFASELGRALVINDGAVQFADEPTETWFRQSYRPDTNAVQSILDRLQPLASKSAYAAATLPQLLLEMGRVDELIQLVLSDAGLPETDDLGRRDVRAMRLRAATQAALRARRHADVAKLAFRTANVEAAETRQLELLSQNPDLAARFVAPAAAAELIATRKIGGGDWRGSDNAHQSALFAGYERFHGDAIGRLRTAMVWLHDHFRRRKDNEARGMNLDDEIVAMAWAQLELHGPTRCANFLRSWQPRDVSFTVGRAICSRLSDAGRLEHLSALAEAAGNDIYLGLAGTLELAAVGRMPSPRIVRRIFRMVSDRRVDISQLGTTRHESMGIVAIVALSVAALRTHAVPRRSVAKLLNRYLPAAPGYELDTNWHDPTGRRDAVLKGFALRAALNGRPLTVERLRHRGGRTRKASSGDDERRRRALAPALPWYVFWADVTLGHVDETDASTAITKAQAETSRTKSRSYREHDPMLDDCLMLRAECLHATGTDALGWGQADDWYPELAQKGQRASIATVASLVKLMASDPERHGLALDLAIRAGEGLCQWRDTAESTVGGHLALARALLAISEAEARAHFDAATASAERLGEENYDRWRALLALAEAASHGSEDQAELAYRLARFAEPTHEHLGKSSYLEWERTAQALARLSPASSLAILSRWADRGFGIPDDQLEVVLHTLVEDGHLTGDVAMLMFPAHDQNAAQALEAGLVSGAERDAVEDIATRYVRVEGRSQYGWRDIRVVAERHGIEWPWLDDAEIASDVEDRENAQFKRTPVGAPDWAALLANLNLTTAGGLAEAVERIGETDGVSRRDLWRILPSRIPVGQEADFLKALAQVEGFDLYDLSELLDRLPTNWSSRMSVPPAVRSLAAAVCRREPDRIPFSAWWAPNCTLSSIAERAGTEGALLANEALSTIAAEEHLGSAGDLFHIASLAAYACGQLSAQAALQFALDEMEEVLDKDDGDGPWHETLRPEGSVSAAVADYLWSMLGSVDASRRWRGAHAVRSVVRWGPSTVLQRLCVNAVNGAVPAFQDGRLSFYHLHALEWLFIAIYRVAVDAPNRVVVANAVLDVWTGPTVKHAKIRGLAARIALSLHRSGAAIRSDDDIERLSNINEDRSNPGAPPPEKGRQDGQKRFFFDYDSRDHFLRSLKSAFQISEDDAEARLEPIMRALATNDTGEVVMEDARGSRGMFRGDSRRDRLAQRRDDWRAYLSKHAVMVLCGQLLDGDSPGRGGEEWYFSPAHFLGNHGLATGSGETWTADRRGPIPLNCRLIVHPPEGDWLARVDAVELSDLTDTDREICVWGSWVARAGRLIRRVRVSTALVSAATAPALVRALETTPDPMDYRLPDTDASFEFGTPRYVLRGWIADYQVTSVFDEHDPWAADMSVGVLRPRSWIVERLLLKEDKLCCTWTAPDTERRMIRQSWSEGERDGDEERNSGDRLMASRSLIDDLYMRTGMVLLREVTVTHEYSGSSSWEENKRGKRINIGLVP